MCEYDTNFLKNDRILTKPWRTRIVILKKNEWVDIDLVGVLLFLQRKRDSKSDELCEYMAIYRDVHYHSTLTKTPEICIIRPQIDEKILRKMHQDFKMPEGECLLFSMIDKRNNYSLVSENFIEWKDRIIGETVGLVFFNNMSCFETWKKIAEIKKTKTAAKRKDKSLSNQCDTYLRFLLKENLPKIRDLLEKNLKNILDITLNQDFLSQLEHLFNVAEENGDAKTIEELYKIVEVFSNILFPLIVFMVLSLVKAGIEQIFNVLMDEKNFLWVFGVLEYSPENVGSRRRNHRMDVTIRSTFKNLNDVLSEEIAKKIKGCYRQSYLLDCVLAADNEANFFFVLQRNIYISQQAILCEVLTEPLIESVFLNFLPKWKDSIDFLLEIFSLIDSSTDIEKKKFFIAKLKSLEFLSFLSNLLAYLMAWNSPFSEKQFWLVKFLKLLRNFVLFDTFYFLQFLESETSRNIFLPMLANLFIFYGFETQIEELWRILTEDVKFEGFAYNPLIDFLEKCLFFQNMVQIRDLFFEEFLNLLSLILQKNRSIGVAFLSVQGRLTNAFSIVISQGKKPWVIGLLKLLGELASSDSVDPSTEFKDLLYSLFKRFYIPRRENLINSIFMELFFKAIHSHRDQILHPALVQTLEFRRARKLSLSKTPEKSICLENAPSNLSLSLQKIDEFEANSKESLPETIIQLVIEEKTFPKPRTSLDKMSIEEEMIE